MGPPPFLKAMLICGGVPRNPFLIIQAITVGWDLAKWSVLHWLQPTERILTTISGLLPGLLAIERTAKALGRTHSSAKVASSKAL